MRATIPTHLTLLAFPAVVYADRLWNYAVFRTLPFVTNLPNFLIIIIILCSSLAVRHHVSHPRPLRNTSVTSNCGQLIWRWLYTHNLNNVYRACCLQLSSQVLLYLRNSIGVTNEINYLTLHTHIHTYTAISWVRQFKKHYCTLLHDRDYLLVKILPDTKQSLQAPHKEEIINNETTKLFLQRFKYYYIHLNTYLDAKRQLQDTPSRKLHNYYSAYILRV